MNARIGPLRRALDADAAGSDPRRTLVIVDRAVAEHPTVAAALPLERMLPIDASAPQDALLDTVTAAIHDIVPDRIVGIGGGRVHDTVTLARLFALDSAHRSRIDALVERHGGIVAPQKPARAELARLVLVPSTIGPGSETSFAACREHGGLRSVVVGPFLRADAALIDPDLTSTLARSAILEGAAEAALRLIGARGGSPGDERADARTRELLGVLATTGERIAASNGRVPRPLRLALAAASAASHTALLSASGDPFAANHWYFANEVSTHGRLRKVPATMPLLPVLWREEPAERRERRAAVWSWFAAPLGLDADPEHGSGQWAQRWGFTPPSLSDADLEHAADAVARRWGRAHAALPGLNTADAHRLLRAAFRPGQAAPIRAESARCELEEVNT
ncbi:iron-containing alcohol dehydrogenase [Microbacteriaceae bacterium VKM Ac-2855]|nr:iron-containing alcohol dehydrogenase [Microbacteriaceae bacterium VKM Ac-2855]